MRNTNVYFIQAVDGGAVKIGKANDRSLSKRLGELQIGNEKELKFIWIISDVQEYVEKHIQSLFKKFRVRGEWYSGELFTEEAFMTTLKLIQSNCRIDTNLFHGFSGNPLLEWENWKSSLAAKEYAKFKSNKQAA